MSTPTLDKSIDCGTSACVQVKLSRNVWSDFLYKNIIIDDGVLTLTPYNISGYIDKVVRVRTPMSCENPDKPCATCDHQVMWTKDTSPPDLMKSHKRPAICHKLGTLKMASMRTANEITIKEAWDRLTRAMIDDPDWAWSVQCNIAMPIMDHLQCNRKDANTAASMLIQHLFHYDITGHKYYQDIINCPVAMSPEQLYMIGDQQRRVVESDKQPETVNNPVEETYVMNQLKQRYPLSDNFDPDYAKFGIKNKYDLISSKLILANTEIPFHQKVKEYFIEHAYYSNSKYPSILFMIGESLNNDSVLFKTLKVGSWETGTIIILNDELNIDDFKLVLNPAGETTTTDVKLDTSVPVKKDQSSEETEAVADQTRDRQVYEFFKIGWTYINKNNPAIRYICVAHSFEQRIILSMMISSNKYGFSTEKAIRIPFTEINLDDWQLFRELDSIVDVNSTATHHENVRNFFTHGMTYLKKHRDGVYYTYRDDMSSHKRLVFECKSLDWGDGPFRTADIERINLDDWQAVESVSGVTKNRYTHEQIKPKTMAESIKAELVDCIINDHVRNVHDFFVFGTKYLNTRVRGARFIFRGYHFTNVLCFEKVETDGVHEYKSIVTYHTGEIYLSDWRSFKDVGLYSFDDTVKFCKEHNVSLITACQSVKELYKLPSIEEHKSTVPPPLDITQELLCTKHMKASSPVTVCENYAEFIKTFGNGNETVAEFISNVTPEDRDSLFELGARYTIRNYPHAVFILKHKSDTVFVFDVIELKSSTYIGLFSMQLSVLKLADIERKHIPESPIHFGESEEAMTNSIKCMESSDGCGVSSEKVGGPTTEGSFKSGVFYQHHDYPNLLLTLNPNWNTFGDMVVFNLIDSNSEPKGTIILKESELKLADFEKVDKPEPQVDEQKICTLDHTIILNEFFKPGVIYRHRQYPIWNYFVVDSKQPESDKIAFIICDHDNEGRRSVQLIKDKIDLSDWTIVAKE